MDKGEKLGVIEGKRLGLKEGIERGMDLGHEGGYQVAKEGFNRQSKLKEPQKSPSPTKQQCRQTMTPMAVDSHENDAHLHH